MAELIAAAKEAERYFNHYQVWCRGHSNKDWPLIPSAHRINGELEAPMANLFRMHAPSLYQKCPSHKDYAKWLPFMRHYGLPTRLLDWTESVSTAAFFAINNNKSSDSTIWFLNPGQLNKVMVKNKMLPFLDSESIRPLVEGAFSNNQANINIDAMAIVASRTEPRMAAQLGAFTIHGSRLPLEEIEEHESFLTRVTIPQNAYDCIRLDLSMLGVRLSNLFPDLDHLAQDIADLQFFESS